MPAKVTSMSANEYDIVVVGSGPNGLSAAITLQQAGLKTILIEAASTVGGGMRSAELTLPGYTHDICSAIHPLAASSPFLSSLPLQKFGLEFIQPVIAAAHPFDDGSAAILLHSIQDTSSGLGEDERAYQNLVDPLVKDWPRIVADVLGPFHFPEHPLAMARFARWAIQPAGKLIRNQFKGEKARGLFAGMAAHGMLPFPKMVSSAAGIVLMIQAHRNGWPMVKGGTQQMANAMGAYFVSLGGEIQCGFRVDRMQDLPEARAVLFDLAPKQILKIAGQGFSSFYQNQLQKYRYGMGVFKVDWALDAPIPFLAEDCRKAGTVHLGESFAEIAANENMTMHGGHPEKPFVILAQQTLFDPSRAPAGKHTAWAYCHVPTGSAVDMKTAIEKQVERFAPGFRERILSTHTLNAEQLEVYNPNYVGGDINGGVQDMRQLFTRPALRRSPYRCSGKGIYICSASTPPGGGVHGMCGYHAAKRVLRDLND
jgi:phytoene dehydrogenase-like protein